MFAEHEKSPICYKKIEAALQRKEERDMVLLEKDRKNRSESHTMKKQVLLLHSACLVTSREKHPQDNNAHGLLTCHR